MARSLTSSRSKALVRRYFEELMNKGDLQIADEIFCQNLVFSDSFLTFHDVDHVKRYLLMVRRIFPDLHYVADEPIVQGERIASCFSYEGTVSNSFKDYALSERRFKVPGVAVFLLKDAKFAEVHSYFRTYDQLQQLGCLLSR